MACGSCGGGYPSTTYPSLAPPAQPVPVITQDTQSRTNNGVIMPVEQENLEPFSEPVVPGTQIVMENGVPVQRQGLEGGYLITPLDPIAVPQVAPAPVIEKATEVQTVKVEGDPVKEDSDSSKKSKKH